METKMTKIPHLRICVTEKCDRRCLYCRPGGEICRTIDKKEMSLRQIFQLVEIMARHGITQLKITGGEPLIRNDIPKMIQLLNSIPGIESVEMVTRSPRAGKLARQLKEAGLSYLDFSLDSLNPFIFFRITKNGRLDALLQAIKICHREGLRLKFNMVVIKSVNDGAIPDMVEFAGRYGAILKLLDLMNMPGESHFLANYYVPFDEITKELARKAKSQNIVIPPGGCGTPMPRFEMPNGAVVIVKDARIGTWYSDVCIECENFPCQDAIMALRLTSDGYLQRCLLRDDNLIDLLSLVENMESQETIDAAVETALRTYNDAVYHEEAWKP